MANRYGTDLHFGHDNLLKKEDIEVEKLEEECIPGSIGRNSGMCCCSGFSLKKSDCI